jgi:hypothetical protein
MVCGIEKCNIVEVNKTEKFDRLCCGQAHSDSFSLVFMR